MKQLLTFLLLIASSVQSFSQVTWSTPVAVYSGGSGNIMHPRLQLNRAGNPVVLWGKNDTRAYFSRWTGTMFTAPVAVNGPVIVFAQTWAGPDLAAFGDTIYAAMKATPEDTGHVYLAHSYDGGMSFSAPVKVDNIDTNHSRFAGVGVTPAGNPLVTFMKSNAMWGNAQYAVARSSDFGNTFSAEVVASTGTNPVCDCCPSAITASGSKAIVLYRNNASNIRDTWSGVSSDGGATFPGHVNVDNNSWNYPSCPSSGPDGVIIGDTLFSVIRSRDAPYPLVYMSRGSVSGLTSPSGTALPGGFAGLTWQDFPRIANSGSAATVVFKQVTSMAVAIIYSFTNNIHVGFTTFDTIAVGNSVMNADVAMTPGVIHVVWQDDMTGKVMYKKGTYTVVPTALPTVSKETIDVHPNPASGNFTVSLADVGSITYSYLSDVTGRQIEIKPTVNGRVATFSVTGIAKGSYYFVLGDDAGKQYYSKLVLQ